MEPTGLSPLERLRQQRHERWLNDLQQQLAETLGDLPCRVWLFGSRARGDWDGVSDTDLLVEAEDADLAEQAAGRPWPHHALPIGAPCVSRRVVCTHGHESGTHGCLVAPGPQRS